MPRPLAIGVFCGSSPRVAEKHLQLARDLGAALAGRGYTLVWGGGTTGMMGELARSAQAAGGRVVGVIPEFLVKIEAAFPTADEMIVTADMRQRKTILEQRSDAFIILPGGLGTLEEMFEMLTLRLLRQHDKPLVIVNHEGFYDGLLLFLEHLYREHFARPGSREHYDVAPGVPAALARVEKRLAIKPDDGLR